MTEQAPAVEDKKGNGAVRRWEPADWFETVQQEMERFWPRGFGFPFSAPPVPRFLRPPATTNGSYLPKMDVFEKDNQLVFKAELPGLKREDVQVEVDNGYLVIRGESKAEQEVSEDAYYRMERTVGSFYRSMALPAEISPDQIKATLTDGVLEVVVPKAAEARPQATKVPVS